MNSPHTTGYKIIICWITFELLIKTGANRVLQGSGAPGEVCEIENGVKGTCETAASCSVDGGITSRNGTTRMCSKSGGEDYYCCRRPFDVAFTLCQSWKSYWRSNDNKCIQEDQLIVGGEKAKTGQFPEIAILGIQRRPNRISWQCGGTLISPHFVLTAAHCVLEFVQYAVRLGEQNLFDNVNGTKQRVIGPLPLGIYGQKELNLDIRNTAPVEQLGLVDDVIIYPEYDGRYHDLALLRLKKPVVMTKRVLPACLPTRFEENYVDERLTIAGWGRIQYDNYTLSADLLKVTIPIIGRNKCEEDLKNENPFLIPKGISEDLICAGEQGKDSCKGDSGGPLLFQDGPKDCVCEHTVVGIVSFGNGCGRFGVYGRVASYIDWITGYIAPGVIPVKRPTTETSTRITTTAAAPTTPSNRVPINFPIRFPN